MNVDGHLCIQCHIKDTIVSGGEKMPPVEVEGAIYMAIPMWPDTRSFGVPDNRRDGAREGLLWR